MKKTSLILLALITAGAHALSDQEMQTELAAANAAYEQRDYSTAYQKYESLAQAGYPEAQHLLARMYMKGLGVVQDGGKAITWYEKAAAQGDANSQTVLGWYYLTGRGVSTDYGQARRWLEKAAAQ